MLKPVSSILNMRNVDTVIISTPPGKSVLNVRNIVTMIIGATRRVDMLILCVVMILTI